MTVPPRNTRLKPLAAGALAVLTALSAMSPVHAAEPVQPDRLLKTFIHDTYGNWRADRKGWQADGDDFVYASCGSLRVATADGPRTLLAMCGETEAAVQNGMPGMDSDATTGTIDLYVLKPTADGRTLEPVVKKTEIASDKRGEPGTVRIERYGPHLFGFTIGDVYPLTVTETGTRGDKAIHARYTVKFDAARGRYVVPKALREGY